MLPEEGFVSVYVTAGSAEEAERVARGLLERRLVACANILPSRSLYWWEGKVEEASEAVMFLKTRRALAERVVAAVRELHSYDVPCAVVFDLEGGNADYLEWVAREASAQ